jgi:hypothetical protein
VLLGVAGVLAVVTAAVNVLLWDGKKAPPTVPFEPMETAVPSSKVVPAGEVVYVEVSAWMWDSMAESERTARVEQAVGIAREGGAKALYLVDENGRELARWSSSGGVELLST